MQNVSTQDGSARVGTTALGWCASTIGRKQIIGVTGLGLSAFVLTHMLGNMLILFSPQKYNEYAHALVTNPLLPVAELGLIALFLVHLALALKQSWANFQARNQRYAMRPSGDKATSPAQRSLWAQGLLILVFVILHLITFKYGPEYTVTYGQSEMRDLHRLVVEVFSQPGYVAWYVVALVVLFFHLRHGVGSAFQTLGINHPRYNCAIQLTSTAYAVLVTLGFLSQPFYVFFLR